MVRNNYYVTLIQYFHYQHNHKLPPKNNLYEYSKRVKLHKLTSYIQLKQMGDDLLGDHPFLDHAFPIPQHSLGDFTVLEAAQLGARTPQLPELSRLAGQRYGQ